MRALFISGLLLCFAGCGTISRMNNNMENMNGTMELNIETINHSASKIEENTAEVVRSTNQLEEFKKIISSNTEQIHNGVDGVKNHTTAFPLIFIAIIALVFLPTIICVIFYHKFFQNMKSNLKK